MARRRQKGSGSVRRLPSGRWQARLDNDAGVRVALGSFATKYEADQTLRLALADQARGRWIDPGAGRLTMGAYAAEWLGHRPAIRPRTAELYESLLRIHILPTFADSALSDISTRSVRRWHTALLAAPHPIPVTVAKAYRLLRSVLGTAVEDGLIASNPCVIKGAGVERSPERPVATIEQVYALADAVPPRFRMVILLATLASMRFGELAALTRERVDIERGLISIIEAASELNDGTRIVGEPKTDAGRRTVAVPPVILDDLRDHLETFSQPGPRGLIFVGPADGPLRRSNWAKIWRAATAPLKLEQLHFHDLRHTGNTLAAATGASTKELMSRMGHSSSRAALLYQHATDERELAIAQRLGEMVSAARPSRPTGTEPAAGV